MKLMEITITVNSDITLTANFEKIPENSSNNKVVFKKISTTAYTKTGLMNTII